MVNEHLLRSLPEEYAALADRRRVMQEVADELAELHAAVTRLGDALEAVGLPGHTWRSPDASLRLVARQLPDITIDRFMIRLAQFASGKGPSWLHGDRGDLDLFHREVIAISGVARRLRGSLQQREQTVDSSRRRRAIARAFGTARVAAALNEAVEILDDFRALEPYMAPLTVEEWKLPLAAPLAAPPEIALATGQGRGSQQTGPVSPGPAGAAHTRARLRDVARATMGPHLEHRGGLGDRLAPLRDRLAPLRDRLAPVRDRLAPLWDRLAPVRERLAPLLVRAQPLLAPVIRRKRLVAIEVALLIGTAVVVLVLHGQGVVGSSVAGGPAAGPALSGADATASADASAPTSSPAVLPTATKTVGPIPHLALTCTLNDAQGTSATLSIKNTGTTTITWQADAPRRVGVSPSQGQVSVGQATTATVTSNRPHGLTGSTITVVASTNASNNATSASYSAVCA